MASKKIQTGHETEQGFALIFLLAFITLLAIATESVFFRLQSNSETSGQALRKERLFYLADGLSQLASRSAQDYLSNERVPTNVGLNAFVTAQLAGLNLGTSVLESLDLTMTGAASTGLIPSGPFSGMDSSQVPVQINVRTTDLMGMVHSAVQKEAVLAKIALFQFSLFGDLPGAPTYLAPGMPMDVRGRIHVNGDFCVGNFGSGANPLRLEKLTVSGGIYNVRDLNCWTGVIGVSNQTSIATDQAFSAFASLDPGSDHGCVNCSASGLNWKNFAKLTWQGNALDSAHDVQKIQIPFKGSDKVQQGVRADLTALANTGSMRVFADPVLAVDLPEVAQEKLSAKAEVRIINGVWYLKDPANPSSWPGLPIWSDHPGRFVATDEEGIEGTLAVGQEDIRSRWNGTANQWGAGVVPRLYSYYEYNPGGTGLVVDGSGTVSYGTLYRAAGPVWRPGQWVNANSPTLCDATFIATNGNATAPLDALAAGSVSCSGGTAPGIPDFLLNATRSGFKDGNISVGSAAPNAAARGRLYPMNFDVASFQIALASTTPGEFGSYFGAGRFMGHPFNGIVYITNTWPGSMAGITVPGLAQDYPFQGSQVDGTQVAISHGAQQQALPFQLCSTAPATLAGGLGGLSFAGPAGHFVVPDCARYAPGYGGGNRIDARPNVIRIINGATISPGLFSNGLSIATNLPVYLQGDYNTSSDSSSSLAVPWIPALVVGDQVTLLSNNWDDANSRWNVSLAAAQRLATDTNYNVSLLSGGTATTPTTWSGGLENLPRYLEKWNVGGSVRTVKIRGSLVMGFSSVYNRNPIGPSNPPSTWGDFTYLPPQRDFGFDDHLHGWANQPPGSPRFDVYSVRRWTVQ